MRRRLLASSAVIAALAIAGIMPTAVGGTTTTMVEFQSMVGVTRPMTGAAGTLRGLSGGGLPWVIGSARGELSRDGRLEIRFSNLVFDPSDAGVIAAGRSNLNPLPTMAVVVSCVTGANEVVNTSTGAFAVTTGLFGGDGRIEASLDLPAPCIAPIIFITNAAGTSWLAATGV